MEAKEYSTGRINNFTDAIFAIAITLLILDIKAPAYEMVKSNGAPLALVQGQLGQIIGLIVSFFVSAIFWKAHLSLSKHITSYNNKLLWLNILMLFFVIILPFSTALYAQYFGVNSAFFFYCVNVASLGFMHFLMTVYVIKKENLKNQYKPIQLKWMRLRAVIVSLVFLLSILISLASPIWGRVSFVLIFIIHLIGDKIVKSKLAPKKIKPKKKPKAKPTED